MATYAAYRHVELDKVGCGKRSIMKPPGGDCHDIFGANFHGTPSHHRVLKPPGGGTSSLFATPAETAAQKPTVPSADVPSSQNSAPNFNGVEVVNGKTGNTILSDHSLSLEKKSSDLDTVSVPSSVISAEIKNLTAQLQKRPVSDVDPEQAENKASPDNFTSPPVHRPKDGNPLTGEGCQTSEHFVIRVHRQRDGNPVTGEGYDNGKTVAPTRTRIPPGGYSSGLW